MWRRDAPARCAIDGSFAASAPSQIPRGIVSGTTRGIKKLAGRGGRYDIFGGKETYVSARSFSSTWKDDITTKQEGSRPPPPCRHTIRLQQHQLNLNTQHSTHTIIELYFYCYLLLNSNSLTSLLLLASASPPPHLLGISR